MITHGADVSIGSSNRHGAEQAVRGARNFQIIPDLQAGVVEPPARLAWLDPNRAPSRGMPGVDLCHFRIDAERG